MRSDNSDNNVIKISNYLNSTYPHKINTYDKEERSMLASPFAPVHNSTNFLAKAMKDNRPISYDEHIASLKFDNGDFNLSDVLDSVCFEGEPDYESQLKFTDD